MANLDSAPRSVLCSEQERVEQYSSGAITVLLLGVRNVARRGFTLKKHMANWRNFRVEMCIRSEKNTVVRQLFLGKIHSLKERAVDAKSKLSEALLDQHFGRKAECKLGRIFKPRRLVIFQGYFFLSLHIIALNFSFFQSSIGL